MALGLAHVPRGVLLGQSTQPTLPSDLNLQGRRAEYVPWAHMLQAMATLFVLTVQLDSELSLLDLQYAALTVEQGWSGTPQWA